MFNNQEFEALENAIVHCSSYSKLPTVITKQISVCLLIVLVKLKHNCDFTLLSVLFRMSNATVAKIFYELLPILDCLLSATIYLPEFKEIKDNMPKYFLGGMEDTYMVMDCFEIPIQIPHCLHCKIISYSRYKGKNKFLVLKVVLSTVFH